MITANDLGLLDSEWTIYSFLIKHGKSTITHIAKTTKLNRVTIYKGINALIEKGLISRIISTQNKYFEASNPKFLNRIIEQKKETLKAIEKEIKTLENTYSSHNLNEFNVKLYTGIDGAKNVWERWLEEAKPGEEWLILGAPKLAEVLGGYFKEFNDKRAKKGVRLKIIYNYDAKSLIKIRKKQSLTSVKTMPEDYATPTSIEVLSEKTLLVLYKPFITIFEIISKETAISFKEYFYKIWENL